LRTPETAARRQALSVRLVASAAGLAAGLWPPRPAPPHLTRARLGDLERDARFTVSYAEVSAGGLPMLALPAYWPQQRHWPDAAYDAGALLGMTPGVPADSLCLVGGRADFRCAALEAADADPNLLDAAAELALGAIGRDAERARRNLALLYTPIGGRLQRAASRLWPDDRRGILGHRYLIPDVGTGLDSYLATLSAAKRSLVRRDLKSLAAAGIHAGHDTWGSVIKQAAPMVAGIHQAHGHTDLPALALARLKRRAADPDVLPVAFVYRSGRELSAVTLGWAHGGALELYEVGLAPDPAADRGLRYLEVMFYAPLRFMWNNGLRTLDLALEAGHPKKLRGADELPVAGMILGRRPG
jgi:hypothetical protein